MKRPIEIEDPSFTTKRPKVIEWTFSLTSIPKGKASKHINLCYNMSEQHAKEWDNSFNINYATIFLENSYLKTCRL